MAVIVRRGDPTPWHLRVDHVCVECRTVYRLEKEDRCERRYAVYLGPSCRSTCPVCGERVRTYRRIAEGITGGQSGGQAREPPTHTGQIRLGRPSPGRFRDGQR